MIGDYPKKRRMDGFAVEEERVGAMTCGLIHVDDVLYEGMHVIDGDGMLAHDLSRDGVIFDLCAFGEDVGTGMPDGCGAGPNKLGFSCLEAGDKRVEVLLVLLRGGCADAAGMLGHHPESLHAGDAVNQITKPAVEMDDFPLTVTELAIQ